MTNAHPSVCTAGQDSNSRFLLHQHFEHYAGGKLSEIGQA